MPAGIIGMGFLSGTKPPRYQVARLPQSRLLPPAAVYLAEGGETGRLACGHSGRWRRLA
jgi:hypothetical protein